MSKYEQQFYRWLEGWLDIAVGLVNVLTLGFVYPSWSFIFLLWWTERSMETEMAKRAAANDQV